MTCGAATCQNAQFLSVCCGLATSRNSLQRCHRPLKGHSGGWFPLQRSFERHPTSIGTGSFVLSTNECCRPIICAQSAPRVLRLRKGLGTFCSDLARLDAAERFVRDKKSNEKHEVAGHLQRLPRTHAPKDHALTMHRLNKLKWIDVTNAPRSARSLPQFFPRACFACWSV